MPELEGTPVRVWDTQVKKEIVAQIARTHLDIQTLDVRGRDSLDFHDVGVACLEAALIAAFEAGRREGV